MANSADPDQMASAKAGHIWVQQDKGYLRFFFFACYQHTFEFHSILKYCKKILINKLNGACCGKRDGHV